MSTPMELPVPLAEPVAPPPLRLAPPPDTRVDDLFDAFVRKYELRLRRLVQRRLGDPGESEEITQETLLRAYQHRHSFNTEDELIAWSTVVAQRLVIDRVRVRGRSVAVADVPEGARVGRDTAEIVVARQQARIALESLEAIPTRQASILWAREVEGLHYEEIADRFDISEPAVRSLLHRGRKALRKEYAIRGGSLPLTGLVPLAPWLVALKSVAKLRTSVREGVGTTSTAAVALSLAIVTALGVGYTQGHPLQRTQALPATPGGAVASALGVPAATRITPPATSTATAPVTPTSVGRAPTVAQQITHAVPTACAKTTRRAGSGSACVGPETNPKGTWLWLGPALPENPTGVRRVGVAQDAVECKTVSRVPSTTSSTVTCTDHQPEDDPLPLPDPDSKGALR